MSETGALQPVTTPDTGSTSIGFDPGDDVWKLRSEKAANYVSFRTLRSSWGDRLTDYVKHAALAYMEDRSPGSVSVTINALSQVARAVPVDATISAATLMNFRSLLPHQDLYYLADIATFLKFWVARSYPGVDGDVLQFFNSIKIPRRPKGAAVRTHHPTKGPFTDAELQGTTLASREACRVGRVRKQDFAILLALTATGSRSGQLSMLVCGDLLPAGHESSRVRLLVPSLKKRTRKRLTRERVIPGELAVLLHELVEERRHDERFRGVPVEQRPIFTTKASAFPSLAHAHIGAAGVREALKRIQKAIQLRSARTAAPIVLAPRRFRTTLGTRAAEAGHPPVVIADLLDHGDLRSVGVYVEARPSIVDRIDSALHDRFEPLVGLFKGAVVANEASCGVDEPSTRRIAAEAAGDVGTCGGPKSCTRLAPLACYTCATFRPWRDAPHEDLLHSLVDEREALLGDGCSPQVASANDATMMAIAEVANRCRRMREAASNG